jgi:hypothetical protein
MENKTEDFIQFMINILNINEEWPRDYCMPRTDEEIHGC